MNDRREDQAADEGLTPTAPEQAAAEEAPPAPEGGAAQDKSAAATRRAETAGANGGERDASAAAPPAVIVKQASTGRSFGVVLGFLALLVAFAVGFAVSVSQYLPTVFAGGGRLETLTTEAVSLAGGGDRRLIGMLVFAQSVLPFLAFLLAAALPAWLFRNRQGMRGVS